MNVVIRPARRGVVAQWFLADNETLVICLADDLDDVTRQRYIAQAKLEHGIPDEHRRRGLIPLLPFGWGHTASPSKTGGAIAAGGGVLVVSVAAAMILPAALRDHSQPPVHRPQAAAPARPSSPQKPRREAPHDKTPTRPGRTSEQSPADPLLPPGVAGLRLPSVPQQPIAGTLPVDGVGSAPAPPSLPKPPALPSPPPIRARPLLRVDLPPVVSARVRLTPRLQVRIRLGTKPTTTTQP